MKLLGAGAGVDHKIHQLQATKKEQESSMNQQIAGLHFLSLS